MDTPKISIVSMVYNTERFLPQCIESLINQTLAEIEIILVNDGSPDKSLDICNRFAAIDERIQVIDQPNRGAMYALINGYNRATGKYLMILDSDDWLNPDTCRVAYETAERENADMVFWSRIKEYGDNSLHDTPAFQTDKVFIGEDIKWLRRRAVGLLNEELRTVTKTDIFSSIWGKLYRRDIIVDNKISALDSFGNSNFDVLFTIRAFHCISKAVYIHKYFSHYRLNNPNSITKNHGLKLINRFLQLFNAIEDFIRTNNFGDEYKQALYNRIALSIINNVMSMTGANTKASFLEKYKFLQSLLAHPLYKKGLANLQMGYLPVHWRIFFLCSKYEIVSGVYLLSYAIRKLR